MSFDMQNMGNMLKKMQDDMARINQELEEARIEGKDPSGKVSCKVNGQREVIEIKIDKSVIDPEDAEMLEDLILFAVRDAMKKAEEFSSGKMGSLTRGLPQIPGFQFPGM
ncbi:MAG TPA: YbaB/EbfC family nucleoid-associated protein [bacterium]|nr:YbaB/EbfC family nucleoid-associated protein [bacterium]